MNTDDVFRFHVDAADELLAYKKIREDPCESVAAVFSPQVRFTLEHDH
jgi:hypothetical protein